MTMQIIRMKNMNFFQQLSHLFFKIASMSVESIKVTYTLRTLTSL